MSTQLICPVLCMPAKVSKLSLEKEEEECVCDVDPKVAMYAQHLDDDNVVNCFEGCIARNG